jgi:biopolymer transport protein ExbD
MKSLRKVEGINVVPLIDIMLVLLTIVLTISSFIALGKIELTLPSASSQTKIEPKSYDIAINARSEFFINGLNVKKEAIPLKLIELNKNDTVNIRADKLTPYEEFVFIINILKKEGIDKIGMAVQDE